MITRLYYWMLMRWVHFHRRRRWRACCDCPHATDACCIAMHFRRGKGVKRCYLRETSEILTNEELEYIRDESPMTCHSCHDRDCCDITTSTGARERCKRDRMREHQRELLAHIAAANDDLAALRAENARLRALLTTATRYTVGRWKRGTVHVSKMWTDQDDWYIVYGGDEEGAIERLVGPGGEVNVVEPGSGFQTAEAALGRVAEGRGMMSYEREPLIGQGKCVLCGEIYSLLSDQPHVCMKRALIELEQHHTDTEAELVQQIKDMEEQLTNERAARERAEGERDAAVREANRRDQKWMDVIDSIVGQKLNYTEIGKGGGLEAVIDDLRNKCNAATSRAEAAEARFTAPIVCMCGSTRFKQTWISENARLTGEGNIVLAVGLWGHHERVFPSDEEKARLDDLHKRKIDLCDWVWVLDIGGYIGESTRSEIVYAKQLGKTIRYLSREFPDYVEPVDEWKSRAEAAEQQAEALRAALGRAMDALNISLSVMPTGWYQEALVKGRTWALDVQAVLADPTCAAALAEWREREAVITNTAQFCASSKIIDLNGDDATVKCSYHWFVKMRATLGALRQRAAEAGGETGEKG